MASYTWSCLACGSANESSADACFACGCAATATYVQIKSRRKARLEAGGAILPTAGLLSDPDEPGALQLAGWVVGLIFGILPRSKP